MVPIPAADRPESVTGSGWLPTHDGSGGNTERRGLRSYSSLLHSRCATAVAGLDRRTRNRAIGAKYATVASEGLEADPAALAIIEEHAGIGWHGFHGLMAA